ncbi:MAG: SGNH/GDSL hydrolase family protein [Lachnospiraceae bacterium]|nr:SGNH/GDSL hydrolase family protein [Lachnospiraceae bacterium]
MLERYAAKYLNRPEKKSVLVLWGTDSDTDIRAEKLAKDFNVDAKVYNKSVSTLSLKDAAAYYEEQIHPLHPNRLLLHLGASDLAMFISTPTDFDIAYRDLIQKVRSLDALCRIGILTLKNPEHSEQITKLNTHLRVLAASEGCEFEDISVPRVWNPAATKSAMSFAFGMGLSKKHKTEKSLYDLAKVFYYSEQQMVSRETVSTGRVYTGGAGTVCPA